MKRFDARCKMPGCCCLRLADEERDPRFSVKVYLSLSDKETGTCPSRCQAWPVYTPLEDNLFQFSLIVAEEQRMKSTR